MCYERGRAEACVDESAHHALVNAGGREIVGKKEGEQKGSARGSVHWGCYYATARDIEVDPQRCCFGSRQSPRQRKRKTQPFLFFFEFFFSKKIGMSVVFLSTLLTLLFRPL